MILVGKTSGRRSFGLILFELQALRIAAASQAVLFHSLRSLSLKISTLL